MYTSKNQIIARARQWNKEEYVGRNQQKISPLTKDQIQEIRFLSPFKLRRKGIEIDYSGTGNNKYLVEELGGKVLIKVPKIKSPSLRFLTGHKKVKGKPNLTLKNRLKCKAGPKVALIIAKSYRCEMSSDKHVFKQWEDVSVDHLISQKRLHLAYLLGIIEKNQFQDRNNLTLMRLTKNAGKGDTNYYQRTINNTDKDIDFKLNQIKNELNVFLRTTEGQFLLSQQKTGKKGDLVFDSQLVQKALFYYGQTIQTHEKVSMTINGKTELVNTGQWVDYRTDYFKRSGLSPIEFVKSELKKEGYDLLWPEKKQVPNN